jgi:CspA family cold shock protein
MKTGVVKFFNATKGYGFIKEDEAGTEVFVHITGLSGDKLNEGDRVSFEIEQGRKGPNAVQVRLIEG